MRDGGGSTAIGVRTVANRYGLSREERLRRRGDFDRVFQEGRRRHGPLLGVCAAPNGLDHARLGIALRRGWKGSVPRNRAKRLVREAFRTHNDELPRGIDVVVLPATNWREPSVGQIAAELIRLLGAFGEAGG